MQTLNLKHALQRFPKIMAVFALFFALCAGFASARTPENGKALMVNLKDGSSQYFMLIDEPVLTFDDYICHVESQQLSADFDMTAIDHAKVIDFDPASVDEIETSLIVDLSDPSVVTIKGMHPGSHVALFNLSGILLLQTRADESGRADLRIADLSAGVYVVTSKEITFKIYKK